MTLTLALISVVGPIGGKVNLKMYGTFDPLEIFVIWMEFNTKKRSKKIN